MKLSSPHPRTWLWKLIQAFSRILVTVLFDLKTCGLDNVPTSGGALLLANHQSYLDPIVLAVLMRRPITFMADSDLFEANRFFGKLISMLHAFPVKQGKGDIGAIKQAIQLLHDGHILNIYPEGSRSNDGEIAKIQSGVALILKRADVPIIPVAIHGAYKAWPKQRLLFRPAPVRVWYGPPLKIEGLDGKQVVALVDQTLRSMFGTLRKEGLPCLKTSSRA